MPIHRLLHRAGYKFTRDEVAAMEIGYIGGLLGLDEFVDTTAWDREMKGLAERRGPSPLRKG